MKDIEKFSKIKQILGSEWAENNILFEDKNSVFEQFPEYFYNFLDPSLNPEEVLKHSSADEIKQKITSLFYYDIINDLNKDLIIKIFELEKNKKRIDYVFWKDFLNAYRKSENFQKITQMLELECPNFNELYEQTIF